MLTARPLKTRPITYLETSVTSYQSTLNNIPEDPFSQFKVLITRSKPQRMSEYWHFVSDLRSHTCCRFTLEVITSAYRSHYKSSQLAGLSLVRIPVGAIICHFSIPVQTDPQIHPAASKLGTQSVWRQKGARGVALTTHPLLVPRLSMSGVIPLLLAYASRLYSGKTFTFTTACTYLMSLCIATTSKYLPGYTFFLLSFSLFSHFIVAICQYTA